MSKKSRFIFILAVLAMCFAFLWPSLSWYVRTPKEEQALALGSLESIKDYSSAKAASDMRDLVNAVKADPSVLVSEDQNWLAKQAAKNFKLAEQEVPSPLTLKDALSSFGSQLELVNFIEGRYRDRILKVKNYYKNSVKLGLDLSGGMNVIVKADLDAVVAKAGDSASADEETLKAEAMTQAVDTLTSRIDRFGLSSPTIRQQGEDRIYIELPGSAWVKTANNPVALKGQKL